MGQVCFSAISSNRACHHSLHCSQFGRIWGGQGQLSPFWAMKQQILGSHIPPCHKHMVIATTLSVHCVALLHCTAAQTRPVPNAALSSPHKAATKCILDCLGQLFPLPFFAAVGGLARGLY